MTYQKQSDRECKLTRIRINKQDGEHPVSIRRAIYWFKPVRCCTNEPMSNVKVGGEDIVTFAITRIYNIVYMLRNDRPSIFNITSCFYSRPNKVCLRACTKCSCSIQAVCSGIAVFLLIFTIVKNRLCTLCMLLRDCACAVSSEHSQFVSTLKAGLFTFDKCRLL